jgi:hypothetical protein
MPRPAAFGTVVRPRSRVVPSSTAPSDHRSPTPRDRMKAHRAQLSQRGTGRKSEFPSRADSEPGPARGPIESPSQYELLKDPAKRPNHFQGPDKTSAPHRSDVRTSPAVSPNVPSMRPNTTASILFRLTFSALGNLRTKGKEDNAFIRTFSRATPERAET